MTARECVKKLISENIKGRKLVIVEQFVEIENYLMENGIICELHVSVDGEKVGNNGIKFQSITKIKNMKDKYYILILLPSPSLDILMDAYGYKRIEDYCGLQEMGKTITETEDYFDYFGNKCNYIPKNLTIQFYGVNSNIYIDKTVTLLVPSVLRVYSNVSVKIGKYSVIMGQLFFSDGSTITIGENASLKLNQIRSGGVSEIKIGNRVTFNTSGNLVAVNGYVEIGDDCMMASQVNIFCGDGHSVYDVNGMKWINSSKEKNSIILKEHVWVGLRSTILSKSVIESGSIIGANSLVKGSFPNNCIIAGNPAVLKKKDICWCRDENGVIKEHEKIYFRKTIEELNKTEQ